MQHLMCAGQAQKQKEDLCTYESVALHIRHHRVVMLWWTYLGKVVAEGAIKEKERLR